MEITMTRELHEARAEVRILSKAIDSLKEQLSFTGLTTEELQGIHGLIQGQIALVSKLQTSDDALGIHASVVTLLDLASLVSKPTD